MESLPAEQRQNYATDETCQLGVEKIEKDFGIGVEKIEKDFGRFLKGTVGE